MKSVETFDEHLSFVLFYTEFNIWSNEWSERKLADEIKQKCT